MMLLTKAIYRVLGCLLALSLAMPLWVLAQQAGSAKGFSAEELDQVAAPIALYPDPLVAQSLMASTYPLEVVQAARFAKDNANLKGDPLNEALKKQTWDDSVKSLVTFPQVLAMMNDKLDWTQKLGDAFLAQQKELMNAVQRLRAKAEAQGNLKTTKDIEDRQARKRFQKRLAKGRDRTVLEHDFPKLAEVAGRRHVIKDNPPLIYHVRKQEHRKYFAEVQGVFAAYRATRQDDRQQLLDCYELRDVAIKVVGVGSVGARRGIALCFFRSRRRAPTSPSPTRTRRSAATREAMNYGTTH